MTKPKTVVRGNGYCSHSCRCNCSAFCFGRCHNKKSVQNECHVTLLHNMIRWWLNDDKNNTFTNKKLMLQNVLIFGFRAQSNKKNCKLFNAAIYFQCGCCTLDLCNFKIIYIFSASPTDCMQIPVCCCNITAELHRLNFYQVRLIKLDF